MQACFSDEQVRQVFLNCQTQIGRLKISDQERAIVEHIESAGYQDSVGIASVFCCSVQSASARLKRLFEKGYLQRTEYTAKSGGIEFRPCITFR
jgi:hypothetical protein